MGNCSSAGHPAKHYEIKQAVLSPVVLHDGAVLSVLMRGDTLFTSSDDRTIARSDVNALQTESSFKARKFVGHKKAVNRICVDSCDRLWSVSRDLSIRRWNMDTCTQDALIEDAHTLNIAAVMCSPSADKESAVVVTGSRDYSVRGWDVAHSTSPIFEYHAPRNIVTALTGRPRDSHLIYQGSEDLCVRVWDSRTPAAAPAEHINGFVYFPLCMSLQQDGHILATGCKGFNSVGCGVMLWDLRKTSSPLHDLRHHTQDVTGVQFLQQSENILISSSKDGSIAAWDLSTPIPSCISQYQFPKKWLSSLSVQQNEAGKALIAVSALSGSISLLDLSFGVGKSNLELSFSTSSSEGDGEEHMA